MEKDWCDEFKSCSFVDFVFTSLSLGDDDDATDNAASASDLAGIFDTRCTSWTLEDNWDFCKNACSPHKCCFVESLDSCYADEVALCNAYSICELFYEDDDDYLPSSTGLGESVDISIEPQFKTLCTLSTIRQNWDTCKDHCERYECCFRGENSCYEENRLECEEYYCVKIFILMLIQLLLPQLSVMLLLHHARRAIAHLMFQIKVHFYLSSLFAPNP